MADDVLNIKTGDLSPPLEATLSDENGPVDLSDIGELRLLMGPANGGVTVDAAAEVVDEEAGKVRYQWAEGDTDRAGLYHCEFKLLTGGAPITFPNEGYILVNIGQSVPRQADDDT